MCDKTVFERIIEGEFPADFVHQDEHCVAIRDIDPKAPIHILIIPREPIVGIQVAEEGHRTLLGHLMLVARLVATQEGILEDGFRLVINAGDKGGQTVPHLHMHLLGGRAFQWPPG